MRQFFRARLISAAQIAATVAAGATPVAEPHQYKDTQIKNRPVRPVEHIGIVARPAIGCCTETRQLPTTRDVDGVLLVTAVVLLTAMLESRRRAWRGPAEPP